MTQRRVDGPTPHGGDYGLITFIRSLEEPAECEEAEAKAAILAEYMDSGVSVFESYAEIKGV